MSEEKNRQLTVLLVEDDPNDALLVSTAFERAIGTATLVHFGDGDAAIRYLGKESPYDRRDDSPKPTMMLLDINYQSAQVLMSSLGSGASPMR